MKVKAKDVDLTNQTVTYTVLKGRNYSIIKRPIKNIALPYWKEAVNNCPPDYYVFAEGLNHGAIPIHRSQIDRRWKRHIIDKLGIKSHWYDMKHTNSTEVERMIGRGAAAANNAESQIMIDKVYNIDFAKNKMQEIKEVNNPFV